MKMLRHVLRALAAAGITGLAPAPAAGPAGSGSSPLRIIQTFEANFPPVLLSAGVTSGQVRVLIHVAADGRLVDHLILAYTHRPLVDELALCLKEWRYEPARIAGEAVPTRAEVHCNFEARGAVLSLTAIDTVAALARWVPGDLTTLVSPPGELDRPLSPLRTVSPRHPAERYRNVPAGGSAVIDFYVDAEGRPRLPAIVSATHEEFGSAALEALAEWRFAPPRRRDQPVCVRARQLFQFTGPPAKQPPRR